MPRVRYRFLLSSLFLVCVVSVVAARDFADGMLDIFASESVPKPRAGQWFEFRLAFPVDPMENALSGSPLPALVEAEPIRIPIVPQQGKEKGQEFFITQPDFNPPVVWRTVPLRLEVEEISIEGIRLVLTFGGRSYPVTIDHVGDSAVDRFTGKFYYDLSQPEDRSFIYRLGGMDYEVTEVRREHESYGFVRWFCPLVPFGVVRYATRDVDLVLVGMGEGGGGGGERVFLSEGEVGEMVKPPLGLLYRER